MISMSRVAYEALKEPLKALSSPEGYRNTLMLLVGPAGMGKWGALVSLLTSTPKEARILHLLPSRSPLAWRFEAARQAFAGACVLRGFSLICDGPPSYIIARMDEAYTLLKYGFQESLRDALRKANTLILEEPLAGATCEGEYWVDEIESAAREAVRVGELASEVLGRGPTIIIASIPPPQSLATIIDQILEHSASKSLTGFRVVAIVYGRENHPYSRRLERVLKSIASKWSAALEITYHRVPQPLSKKLATEVVDAGYCGGLADLKLVAWKIEDSITRGSRRILVIANTWRRAVKLYNSLGETCRKFGLKPLLLTSKLTWRDEARIAEESKEDRVCLFTTPASHAGLEASFDVLISEAAPSYSLHLRTGKVARYGSYTGVERVIILSSEACLDVVAGGVYSITSLAAAIGYLRSALGWELEGEFYWRCSNSIETPDSYSMAERVDDLFGTLVSDALRGLREESRVSLRPEGGSEPLTIPLLAREPVKNVLENVNLSASTVGGGTYRLVKISRGEAEYLRESVITVDSKVFSTISFTHLDRDDEGRPSIVALVLERGGDVFLAIVRVESRLEALGPWRALEDVYKGLKMLGRGEVEVLGFLLDEKAYLETQGLIPPEYVR